MMKRSLDVNIEDGDDSQQPPEWFSRILIPWSHGSMVPWSLIPWSSRILIPLGGCSLLVKVPPPLWQADFCDQENAAAVTECAT